ncbi:MAG TPA: hypothetical protein GXZ49_09935 [Bacteroidetes bacterium]|jgi:hypothetical protein|nr:hypothetical protein [Bacteroidota bacterium]
MKKIPLLLIVVSVILLFSCEKNYTGKIMFWFREPIAQQLASRDVMEIRYYLDNVLVGTQDPGVFFSSAPQCGAADLVTITKELGNKISFSGNVKITDQDGGVLLHERINFSADECYILELQSLLPE